MGVRGYGSVVAAFVVAVGVVGILAFVPLETSVEERVAETGTEASGAPHAQVDRETRVENRTIAETDGWGVVLGIAVLLLAVSGLPLLASGRRTAIASRAVSTALLVAGMVLAMSVSVFIAPIALLMFIATVRAVADRRTPTPRTG